MTEETSPTPPVAQPEAVDLLVLGGTVLTMDANNRVLADGGVAVKNGRVFAVDSASALQRRYRADEVLTAAGQLIMPGLVDSYAHAGHGLIRGLFEPVAGWPAGELYWHATSEAWWYAEARLAATERLRFGVTSGFSVVGATPARCDSPVFAVRNAEAYAEVGVRVVIGVGPPEPTFPHLPAPWSGSFEEPEGWVKRSFDYRDAIANSESVIRDWHGAKDGRVRVALAPPYLFGRHVRHPRHPQDPPTAAQAPGMLERAHEMRALADRHGVIVHTHMFAGSVRYALEHFGADEVGELLGSDVVVAHANGLLDDEIEVLGEARCSIATVAHTHENLWYGVAPTPELLAAGANVTIATDGAAPYASLDLWRELSRARWNQWFRLQDQQVLGPDKLLRMVTIDAAHALGLGDEVGSLEVGKRADLITVDLQRPHLVAPVFTPHLLCHYATGHDVDTVLVDGELLMREGRPLGVDPQEVAAVAHEQAVLALERLGGSWGVAAAESAREVFR